MPNTKVHSEVRTTEEKRFIELLSAASPETVTLVSHVLNGTMSPKDALFFAEVLKLQHKREILET